MKKLFAILLLASTGFVTPVGAEGTITKLKVDADVVYFTTDQAKPQSLPQCVASGNEQEWAVSLNTATGKAIYTLLVTASAQDRKITVESANDCADALGVERARSVEVGEKSTQNNVGNSLNLYKADGVTLVGKILAISGTTVSFNPASDESNSVIQLYEYAPIETSNYAGVHYLSQDCTGSAFSREPSKIFQDTNVGDGQIYQASSSVLTRAVGSYWREYPEGLSCQKYNNTPSYQIYYIQPYEHQICGADLCVIKE